MCETTSPPVEQRLRTLWTRCRSSLQRRQPRMQDAMEVAAYTDWAKGLRDVDPNTVVAAGGKIDVRRQVPPNPMRRLTLDQ
jgi:hypothetical protein